VSKRFSQTLVSLTTGLVVSVWPCVTHAVTCLPGAACPSDVFQVTDGMSNVLTDANGKLASITLAEGAEAGDVVFDFAGATVAGGDRVVALTDGLPNPDVSDVLVLHAVSLSSGAGLELAFASDSDPAILAINGGCSANNTACTAETGAVQDVTRAPWRFSASALPA